MITRRGFLTGMLALGAAPAIVRAASLMPLVTPAGLVVPSNQLWMSREMLQQAADRTALIREMADQYVIFMHPSAEEAMRELMITGSATVIYQREVLRHRDRVAC